MNAERPVRKHLWRDIKELIAPFWNMLAAKEEREMDELEKHLGVIRRAWRLMDF